MKKIYMVSRSSLYSGAERMLAILCYGLHDAFPEFRIHLIASSAPLFDRCQVYARSQLLNPLAKVSANPLLLFVYMFKALSKLFFIHRYRKSDVIIFNDLESLVSAWPLALRMKSFFYLHDSHNLGRLKGRLICRLISMLVDDILVITKARQNKLAAIGAINTRYFPNCIDPSSEFHLEKKERLENEIHFLCMSQITAWKRIDKSIAVFKKLAEQFVGYDCFLHIYGRVATGDTEGEKILEAIQKESNNDARIIYHGYIANSAEAFLKADVLINMSLNEPFGLVLVEALQAGCYIISAEGEGPDEIIIDDKCGFIIRERGDFQLDIFSCSEKVKENVIFGERDITLKLSKYLYKSYRNRIKENLHD
jgi:glycosyltransferase involved in cell wall biosynthesis